MFHAQVLRMKSSIIDTHDIIKKSVRYSERVSQLQAQWKRFRLKSVLEAITSTKIFGILLLEKNRLAPMK